MAHQPITEELVNALQSSVWIATPITQTPSIELSCWSVWAIGGKYYFVGYNETEGEGRVSSAIRGFDPKTLRGVTDSGRIYQLLGEPGHDPDGMYIWQIMLQSSRISAAEDVTALVMDCIAPTS